MTALPKAAGLLARDPRALGEWLPHFRNWAIQAKGAWIAEEVSQEVAIRCLKLMRSGGFPCESEKKLQNYMHSMVRNAVKDARRRKSHRLTQADGHDIDLHVAEEAISPDAWIQFGETRTRALACIKTTEQQRAALERRIECVLGADLVSLLVRDGKLGADAGADEQKRAVDNDGRLQRSALSILEKALDIACDDDVIDPDSAQFARRVVAGLRERVPTPADRVRSHGSKSRKDEES